MDLYLLAVLAVLVILFLFIHIYTTKHIQKISKIMERLQEIKTRIEIRDK